MKGSVKKAIIIIGVLIVLVICVLLNLRPVENFQQKYEGVDLSADVEGAVREGTYTKYLNAHEDAACPAEDIEVDLFAYMEGSNDETTLFVQFLDMIKNTCRTGGLHGETRRFSWYPPECKTPVLSYECVDYVTNP